MIIFTFIHLVVLCFKTFAWEDPPVMPAVSYSASLLERLLCPPALQRRNHKNWRNWGTGAWFPGGFLEGNSFAARINIPIHLEITSWFSITHANEVIKSMLTLMSLVFCLKCVLPGRKYSGFESQRIGSQLMFCYWQRVTPNILLLPSPSALCCPVQGEQHCVLWDGPR